MKDPTDVGMNRTGIDISPIDSKKVIKEAERTSQSSPRDIQEILAERAIYIQKADPIGSVPPPGTVRGMVEVGTQKIVLKRPEVLIAEGFRFALEKEDFHLETIRSFYAELVQDEAKVA